MSNFNTTNQNQNIIPKDCIYKCGTRIYWDIISNSCLEVFTKQKHICKNRSSNNNTNSTNNTSTYRTSPYYNKKPGPQSQKCPTVSSC